MKKIKLALNKTTVYRLQDAQQAKVFGGAQPTTWLDGCLKETDYILCGSSSCHYDTNNCDRFVDDCQTVETDNCKTVITNTCRTKY